VRAKDGPHPEVFRFSEAVHREKQLEVLIVTIEQLQQKLESTIKKHELEIERLQAVTAIQNCMGHYETVHITPMENSRTPECFAMWRPDCSCEVSDWGCIFGPEAMKRFWEVQTGDELRGGIFFHTLTTPIIQVAGNGKTAKVTWASPGFETMPPFDKNGAYKSFWCWGKYGMDFIKNPETGEWKIWHMKWFRTIRSDFYKSWYDDAKETLVGMPGPSGGMELDGRLPSVFHRPYSPDEVPHPFPIDPEPYETYDGDFRWLFGGPEYEKKYNVNYPGYEKKYNVDYPEPL
jgi:hypothetical protein